MSDEILTGYSRIIEALTEQGRWQAARIRELEEENSQLIGRLKIGPYGDDEIDALQAIIEQREHEADRHKKSCADALARSLEATEECLRMGAEIERLRELERITQELLYRFNSSRKLSMGSIDSHRDVRYTRNEIERARQALERSGD